MSKAIRNAKGEGSFRDNPDGTVTHRKSVGFKADGHRKILTVTAKNKAACIREMKKKEAAWNKQKETDGTMSSVTIEELCKLHLAYQVSCEELKPKSIDRRECTIENHIANYPLGRMQVQSVKIAEVDDHVSNLVKEGRLSASSIEKVVDVLNAAYKWGIIRGDLEFNPVAPIKPTLEKRIQKMQQKSTGDADVVVLSKEEEEAFKREALKIDEKTGKYVYTAGLYGLLLLNTGMRCGEMLALRWKDIDSAQGFLTIEKSQSVAKNRGEGTKKYVTIEGTNKNSKARKVKLTSEAEEILKLLWNEKRPSSGDELIVTTRTGRSNTATNLEHRMKVIFNNAGYPEISGGLHIFRRTFATRLYEKGVRVKEIAAYIGDLESTTMRYYIAVRKKVKIAGKTEQVVILPIETSQCDKVEL